MSCVLQICLVAVGSLVFQNQQLSIFGLYIKTHTWCILGFLSQPKCFLYYCIYIFVFAWLVFPFVAGLAGVGHSYFLAGPSQKADHLLRLEVRKFLGLQMLNTVVSVDYGVLQDFSSMLAQVSSMSPSTSRSMVTHQ